MVKTAGLDLGVIRFPAEWGSEPLATIRAVPAAVLALSGRVPGGPHSPECTVKRIGPTFGIRTVGNLNAQREGSQAEMLPEAPARARWCW